MLLGITVIMLNETKPKLHLSGQQNIVCGGLIKVGGLPICVPAGAAGRGGGAHDGEARLWCETGWA